MKQVIEIYSEGYIDGAKAVLDVLKPKTDTLMSSLRLLQKQVRRIRGDPGKIKECLQNWNQNRQ